VASVDIALTNRDQPAIYRLFNPAVSKERSHCAWQYQGQDMVQRFPLIAGTDTYAYMYIRANRIRNRQKSRRCLFTYLRMLVNYKVGCLFFTNLAQFIRSTGYSARCMPGLRWLVGWGKKKLMSSSGNMTCWCIIGVDPCMHCEWYHVILFLLSEKQRKIIFELLSQNNSCFLGKHVVKVCHSK
jgi:hypothetical protein